MAGLNASTFDVGGSRKGHAAVRLSSRVELGDDKVTSEVHLAPFGTWEGHPAGPFKFTREVFEKIIANFKAIKNDLQVDYEHDSVNEKLPGPKPAAGWIKSLDIRGNGWGDGTGLWALVEWTQRAAEMIRAGEYKYTSPVIDFEGIDRRTGKPNGPELFNAAITNNPFLDSQIPLRLKRTEMAEETKEQAPEQLTLQEEQAADATALINALAESTGLEPAAVIAGAMDKMDEIAKIIGGVSEEDGTEAEAAEEPPAASDKPEEDAAFAAVEEKNAHALSRRIESLESAEKARQEEKITGKIEELKTEGKVLLDDESLNDARALFRMNWDRACRVYSKKLVPVGDSQAGQDSPKGDSLTADEERQLDSLVKTKQFTRKEARQRVLARR